MGSRTRTPPVTKLSESLDANKIGASAALEQLRNNARNEGRFWSSIEGYGGIRYSLATVL